MPLMKERIMQRKAKEKEWTCKRDKEERFSLVRGGDGEMGGGRKGGGSKELINGERGGWTGQSSC